MNTIQTQRLTLRRFLAKDAEGLFNYLSRSQVNCFVEDRLSTIDEAKKEVDKFSKQETTFAVTLTLTDQVIGHLFTSFEEPDTYSVCWHFNPDFGGKGYATESAIAYIDYLFQERGARRIYAYVEDDNQPSKKLCERLGMRKEGTFIEFISFVKNEDGSDHYENTMQYALLKREWEQQK